MKVIRWGLYTVSVFLFIEISLRICFPIPELSNFNRINYQILDREDDYSGYLRNIQMTWRSVLDTNYAFVHDLNRYGYRDPKEWKQEKKAGVKRIFFLGDSFVEGMMSTANSTIPMGYESEAKLESKEIEWFNCGMMGVGFNEYIKFLKDAVPIFLPDEVYLVMYSNDAPFQREYLPTERLNPSEYSFWEPRIFVLIKSIKQGDPIPFQFYPESRPFYKPVPDPGNPWTRNEQELKKEVVPKIAEAMKKGDFNYFRTNWILEEQKFLKSQIDITDKLVFLKKFLDQYGVNLQLFYVPSRSQVTNFYYQFERQACLNKCPDYIDLTTVEYQQHAKTIAQDCKNLGIPFYDLTSLIRKEEESGNHLYWNYDDHMRGKGYLLLGKQIYHLTQR